MINKEQYAFLKRIEKQPLESGSLTSEEEELACDFVKQDMLKKQMVSYSKDVLQCKYCYMITPFGKSVASNYIFQKQKAWIPIALSIVAILISLGAFLLSLLQ